MRPSAAAFGHSLLLDIFEGKCGLAGDVVVVGQVVVVVVVW